MTPRRFMVLAAALLLPGPVGAQSWSDVSIERDVMITARDGVRLATDIYRPARDGVATTERLPVLLQRTPYGKHTDRFLGREEGAARAGSGIGHMVATSAPQPGRLWRGPTAHPRVGHVHLDLRQPA